MIHQVKMKPNTRDTITIAHPHSPLITAMTRDNSKDPSSSESDTEIKNKKHSTRGLAQTVNCFQKKDCTKQKTQLKMLKSKLDNSQKAYQNLLE